MKINIYFESFILSSDITSPITVGNILENLRDYLKLKDMNYLVLNSNIEVISEDTTIFPKKEAEDFYIIPRPNLQTKTVYLEKEDKIEDLIMKVTGASHKLSGIRPSNPEKVKKNDSSLRFALRENNDLANLMEILQVLERRNVPRERSAPNENYIAQLVDMGFPEDRAREALTRSGNDINRATDYLLSMDGEGGEGNEA
ncbi:MAG: hypothetical protein MJ252_21195 [archaeon]|nr:hypothetical protein [archaeon]